MATRPALLHAHPSSEAVLRFVEPVLDSGLATLALAAASALFLGSLASWVRVEVRAEVPLRDRLPRLAFLASTFALFAITYVHGPVLGFLVFATAHAIEYIAFVHHFAGRAYAARRDTFAAGILRYPARSALAIVSPTFCLYVWLRMTGYTLIGVFVVYEVAFAMVHFVYDGWVWKARSPSVRASLDLA